MEVGVSQSINQKIIADLKARMATLGNRSSCLSIKLIDDLDTLVDQCSEAVTLAITRKSQFVSIAATLGRLALTAAGQPYDTPKAVHLGAFLIEAYDNTGLVLVELGKEEDDVNSSYFVVANSGPDYDCLVESIEICGTNFPSSTPYAPWTSGVHSENGLPFVKGGNPSILNRINQDEHHLVLSAVNKLQANGWKINLPVFEVFKKLHRKGDCPKVFPHMDLDLASKTRGSLRTESKFIIQGAESVGDASFYHQYNVDFRGRIYPLSAFLNEQSSDRSKGIVLFDEPKSLGPDGLFWLLVHTANTFGYDKDTLEGRAEFVRENIETWSLWADEPLRFTGWHEADKPWSFLAALLELSKFMEFEGDPEDFETSLPIFIDGSNNGVQHMTALVLDETTAPMVNLVPQDLPGDVYMTVCEKVFDQIGKDYDPTLDEEFEKFFTEYKLRRPVKKMDKQDYIELAEWVSSQNPSRFAANYWMKISTDKKLQRKIVKRPVMVLGYGGTKSGFGKMVQVDNATASEDLGKMLRPWAYYLGDLIYLISRGGSGFEAALPGLAKSLSLFEGLASDTVKSGSKFGWTVPITNFPVVQQYRKPRKGRVRLDYKGNEMRLSVHFYEDQKIWARKQKSSAAPNIIHSFDAAHLAMTVASCDYRTATIHDSFGCLPGDMADLFVTVRETFVDFYETDPLRKLLQQHDAEDRIPVYGTLDIEDILKSDYAFA